MKKIFTVLALIMGFALNAGAQTTTVTQHPTHKTYHLYGAHNASTWLQTYTLATGDAVVIHGGATFVVNANNTTITPAVTFYVRGVLQFAELNGNNAGKLTFTNAASMIVMQEDGIVSINCQGNNSSIKISSVTVSEDDMCSALTALPDGTGHLIQGNNGLFSYPSGLTSSSTPLPVHLIGFAAKRNSASTVLTWSTSMEENNNRYEVTVSNDARSWSAPVTTVYPTSSNSSSVQEYEFIHKSTAYQYYRLSQFDNDGTVTHFVRAVGQSNEDKVISTAYWTLEGRPTTAEATGFKIRVNTHESGIISREKLYIVQ